MTAELSDKAWRELQVWLRVAAAASPLGPHATCWKSCASHDLGSSRKLRGSSEAIGLLIGLRLSVEPPMKQYMISRHAWMIEKHSKASSCNSKSF
jgi:hypothetical protein